MYVLNPYEPQRPRRFSTKERCPLIDESFRDDLYGYIGGIITNQGAVPLEIGGIDDHLHLLLGLNPMHRIDYLLRDIKAGSSGWLRREEKAKFAWQSGYGAFSVSPDRASQVRNYVRNQEIHHSKQSFKDEYVTILDASGIPYDAECLW